MRTQSPFGAYFRWTIADRPSGSEAWLPASRAGLALLPRAIAGSRCRLPLFPTVNGCRVRVTAVPSGSGWAFTMNPARMRHAGIALGSQVTAELAPEGPQRGDLADDIAAALEANPAAGAFFDGLAQFYRRAYLRYIDAAPRKPDLRAARIAEVVGVLAAGVKGRPRS